MKLLDVNVLVAAHREDHSQFERADAYLERLRETGDPFAVTDLVAGSFLRVVTNRRIFMNPTPVLEAFAYVRAARAQPGHLLVNPGPRHLALLERLCRDADAAGDLVPDAQLAALAIEHGAEVVSFDRDFARFPGLRWSHPGG